MASFLRHLRVVSGLTLVSRVAGLVRDAALAHVLGATQTVVMDAYAWAFLTPNLFRRLFGEGALSAAFIPVFTDYLEAGQRRAASRFMSLMVVLLVAGLGALVLVAEGLLLLGRHLTEGAAKWHLFFGLAAVLLPFAVTICVVALLQAALNCRRHFVAPALAPILLNLFIIAAAVGAGLAMEDDPFRQVYVIAVAIMLAGLAQVAIQLPALKATGLELRPAWDLAHPGLTRVLRLMGPMVIALGVVQLNVFFDSTIANLFSPYEVGLERFTVAGRSIAYPMQVGAASVLYYGQRLYNFPLGVFAVALATVVFPVLSRHAVRKDMDGLGRTASHALRLTMFIGVPAGVGLILVARPLLALWLNHGSFAADPEALPRCVRVAQLYAVGIWAYSAQHILLRTFYALEDTRTPLRVAVVAAALNAALNLSLIWVLAEGGLAIATATSAMVQTVLLVAILNRRCRHLEWRAIASSAGRTLMATALMAGAAWAAMHVAVPGFGLEGAAASLARLIAGVAVGAGVFAGAAHVLGLTELRDLLRRAPVEEAD